MCIDHSALIRNLIKLKGTAKLTAQGERVWLNDSKYVLFEIPANRTWNGRTSSCWPSKPDLAGLAIRSLYCPSVSYLLGFLTKYIWNPWGIPVHPVQLVLLYLSTLLDSSLTHCDYNLRGKIISQSFTWGRVSRRAGKVKLILWNIYPWDAIKNGKEDF